MRYTRFITLNDETSHNSNDKYQSYVYIYFFDIVVYCRWLVMKELLCYILHLVFCFHS